MLLAIDTSGVTAVALLDADGRTVVDLRDDDPRGHAEHIGPLLQQALAAADGAVVEAVAYGVGPGPFTGLRVGVVAARAAAFALGAAELPVLSHDAVALGALQRGTALPFVVTADAKRRERFFSVYAGLDSAGLPLAQGGPHVGADVPDLRVVEGRVDAALLGLVALRRRDAGLSAPSGEARYLRSPDVTLAAASKSVLG